ncbi:TPA: hypothetical protein OME38_003938 [Klebsiella oxytoca]|nr:hypothetical protein [Klebsiella oxytoca]
MSGTEKQSQVPATTKNRLPDEGASVRSSLNRYMACYWRGVAPFYYFWLLVFTVHLLMTTEPGFFPLTTLVPSLVSVFRVVPLLCGLFWFVILEKKRLSPWMKSMPVKQLFAFFSALASLEGGAWIERSVHGL